MPTNPPLRAAGPRSPNKRPRPVPPAVKAAIVLMVYGDADDPDCAPMDFITAGKRAGIKPDIMRKYLDRAEVRSLLRAERQAFRAAVCSGNELALQRIRDRDGGNDMAKVAAIKTLEAIEDDAGARPAQTERPGITIRILPAEPTPQLRDVTPPPRTIEYKPDEHRVPATSTRHDDES